MSHIGRAVLDILAALPPGLFQAADAAQFTAVDTEAGQAICTLLFAYTVAAMTVTTLVTIDWTSPLIHVAVVDVPRSHVRQNVGGRYMLTKHRAPHAGLLAETTLPVGPPSGEGGYINNAADSPDRVQHPIIGHPLCPL